ncbi:hypothetical protein LYSHEL_27130 [Lysobacter helvus]|uniref:Excalibur calcium-binding domain-containing protein n=2 Tax=Lysobacteraceae TaxID=32033 RepID=A0ABM7Q8C2_9GAMM|nr:hypothetical protein LYSCAS_27100 [Lysobacter caseinilyticus]BCT96842.1 hypothetical protein LYSHEL_27130 [Lysobacter helvus]
MKNVLILLLVAGIAWLGYAKYSPKPASGSAGQRLASVSSASIPPARDDEAVASLFKCDGRTMCSQMTSCAEATYFVQHCPNTRMDGNNDGVPCERQWCN